MYLIILMRMSNVVVVLLSVRKKKEIIILELNKMKYLAFAALVATSQAALGDDCYYDASICRCAEQ